MSEQNTQPVKTIQNSPAAEELRLFPFITAGIICFTTAVFLGVGSWYLFGSANQPQIANSDALNSANATQNQTAAANKPENPPPVKKKPAQEKRKIENTVEVSGGEIVIGGGDTKMPLERSIVGDFLIAETEVTNAQYAEFIKETDYPAPPDWKDGTFPAETENFPVTNVSWRDAIAFCEWLEKKIGLPVRLPTEAEWEMAARGSQGFKYPWGNDWNDDAASSKESGAKISAARSFPLNRSPFGAFDMAGNVWEWTQDKVGKDEEVTDQSVEEALESGKKLRVVKGGSAKEPAEQISAQARYEIPEKTKVPAVGFRYVVVRK